MTDKLRAAAKAALEMLNNDDRDCAFAAGILRAALAETQMPTKIFGPNLEETLNAAGFYRKKEWVGLTDDEIEYLRNDQPWWMVRDIEAKLREKNS